MSELPVMSDVCFVFVLLLAAAVAMTTIRTLSTPEGLRQKTRNQLWSDFNIEEAIFTLEVYDNSPLTESSLSQPQIETLFEIPGLAIVSKTEKRRRTKEAPLQAGEMLLIVGTWENLKKLNDASKELLFPEEPKEFALYEPNRHKVQVAAAIVAATAVLKLANSVPIVIVTLLTATAAILAVFYPSTVSVLAKSMVLTAKTLAKSTK